MLVAALALSSAFTAPYAARGSLRETEHSASDALCDPVKQYSGYYDLTTGDK
jgi:hypothetical protein